MNLYDRPRAYEIAYSWRDFVAECDFALAVARRALGRPARSAVELAAGPARHGREFAKRGLAVSAVDCNPGALAYLARVAPELSAIEADLREFSLPQPVDLALCPLCGFAYLLTDADWHAAFDRVAAALVPGGVLVLELLPHDAEDTSDVAWTATDAGETVTVSAGPSRWVAESVFEWELSLTYNGETMVGLERQRCVTPAHAERLVREHRAFRRVRCWGGYDLRQTYRGTGTSLVITAVRA